MKWYRAALVCFALMLTWAAPLASADPWIAPGDVQARADVELLADAGVIRIPIATWPLPWGSISAALAAVQPDTLSPAEQLAYQRLLAGVRAVQDAQTTAGYTVAGAPGRPALRWFGATPRGKAQAGVFYAGYKGVLAYRLNVGLTYGSPDHQRGRLDGSYVSVALGNWIATLGEVDQYWGPGWSGSLILGTNSRPPPGIMLSRNNAAAFKTKWLHWLGPWNLVLFADRLENNRYVPHPYLLGARLDFRPTPGFEMGISRTAEFGGAGRPAGLHCLWYTIIGKSNTPPGQPALTKYDCANQEASFDFRFRVPLTRLHMYTQWDAEDQGGRRFVSPSRWTGLYGISGDGGIGRDGGNYRWFAEYANTTTSSWHTPQWNYAYENYIYRSGYRYRGFTLGYPTDNDSELWTAGIVVQGVNGGNLSIIARHGTLNGDNRNAFEPWGGNKLAPVRTTLNEVDGWFTPSFWQRHLKLGLGVTQWAPTGSPSKTGLHGELSWQYNFR